MTLGPELIEMLSLYLPTTPPEQSEGALLHILSAGRGDPAVPADENFCNR